MINILEKSDIINFIFWLIAIISCIFIGLIDSKSMNIVSTDILIVCLLIPAIALFVMVFFSEFLVCSIINIIFIFILISTIFFTIDSNKNNKFDKETLVESLTNYYTEIDEDILIYSKENFIYNQNLVVYKSSLKDLSKNDERYTNYLSFCNELLNNPSLCSVQLTDKPSNKGNLYYIDDILKTNNGYILKTKYKSIDIKEEYIHSL